MLGSQTKLKLKESVPVSQGRFTNVAGDFDVYFAIKNQSLTITFNQK